MKKQISTQSKDEVIRSLQQRNTKLKLQKEKIQAALENQSQIAKASNVRLSLVATSSEEVIIKQLSNANKMIAVYQTQIKNMNQNHIESGFEKIQSLEKENFQKSQQVKQLKKKLYSISKSIDGNSRKLTTFQISNDDLQLRLAKLNEEASSLSYFVEQARMKFDSFEASSVRQKQRIKELQKNLLSLGVPYNQLAQQKSKCDHRYNSKKRQKSVQNKDEEIEDRTIDRFNQLKNQLKIMGKLGASYEKQIQLLTKDIYEIENKQSEGVKQFQYIQQRIKICTAETSKMKDKIKPIREKRSEILRRSRDL